MRQKVLKYMPIVAILVAISLYKLNQKVRKPVWHEGPIIKIFDSSITNNSFYVFDKDSNKITNDVFVQEIVIWNAGNTQIKKEDIRIPLSIIYPKEIKLIDFQIVNQVVL